MSKLWEKAEGWASEFFKGDLIFGSGRGRQKSDVSQKIKLANGRVVDQTGSYRCEVKSTSKDSITFDIKWIFKIIKESRTYNQVPSMYLVFDISNRFALVPTDPSESTVVLSSSTSFSPVRLKELSESGIPLFIKSTDFPSTIPLNFRYQYWKVLEDTLENREFINNVTSQSS